MEKTVKHLKQYLAEFHGSESRLERPLFYSKAYGRINELSSDTFEKMIKKYADQCRQQGEAMPDKVHCHMLRKARAMDLYREGVPLTHIQQLFGHENISTTSGFYAFATLDVLADAMKAVSKDDGMKLWSDPSTMDRLYRLLIIRLCRSFQDKLTILQAIARSLQHSFCFGIVKRYAEFSIAPRTRAFLAASVCSMIT